LKSAQAFSIHPVYLSGILAGPQNKPKICQRFNKRILQWDSTLRGEEKADEVKIWKDNGTCPYC